MIVGMPHLRIAVVSQSAAATAYAFHLALAMVLARCRGPCETSSFAGWERNCHPDLGKTTAWVVGEVHAAPAKNLASQMDQVQVQVQVVSGVDRGRRETRTPL